MNTKLSFVLLAAAVSGVASAQNFVAVNGLGGTPGNRLARFNAANPAGWTAIGPMAADNRLFTGLDFAGANGALYAWSNTNQQGLYLVNETTGATTFIGGAALPIQDLSYNPRTGKMVGLVSGGTTAPIDLVDIDLATGATTMIGTVTGINGGLAVGLGHDSAGNAYIHDIAFDKVHKLNGLVSSSSITLPVNTNFSQGMTVNWSGNNKAYVAAIGNSPAFFSELLELDFSAMTTTALGNFGTAPGVFPTFEGNDIAIKAVPEPASLLALGAGALLIARRRRA